MSHQHTIGPGNWGWKRANYDDLPSTQIIWVTCPNCLAITAGIWPPGNNHNGQVREWAQAGCPGNYLVTEEADTTFVWIVAPSAGAGA